MNWAELFTEEARDIQPAPKRVTSLLKSYRYANENFGAAVAATCIQRIAELQDQGHAPWEAAEEAYKSVLDDFVNHANEDRVREFFDELKPSGVANVPSSRQASHQYFARRSELSLETLAQSALMYANSASAFLPFE